MTRILILFFAFLTTAFSAHAGIMERSLLAKSKPIPPPMIKVLVVRDKQGVVLEVKGKYHIYDPRDNSHMSTRFTGKRKYIQALTDGIQWGEGFPGVHQLLIVPDDQSVTTIVDGIEYRGSIYVYDVEGKISIINEVFVEDFLKSILEPQLADFDLPEEVLAALAITQRTNAYYQITHPKSNFWAVDGLRIGYKGYSVTDAYSPVSYAVNDTRYLIMTKSDVEADVAEPFPAQWPIGKQPPQGEGQIASISLDEAVRISEQGNNAAAILSKAFPGSRIILKNIMD